MKNILITGSAKRLGRELAFRLAKQGNSIALHHNTSETEAESLEHEILKLGVKCSRFKADFLKQDQYGNLIKNVFESFGNIDLIINNASIFPEVCFKDTTVDMMEQNFSVHVKAPFKIISDYSKLYKNSNVSGHIINIIDTNISKNKLTHFAYLLSKKSLLDLTEMSAVELAPKIRVNAVCPTAIKGFEDTLNVEKKDLYYKKVPMKKITSSQEILNAINYLDDSNHTGQIIYTDGGMRLL